MSKGRWGALKTLSVSMPIYTLLSCFYSTTSESLCLWSSLHFSPWESVTNSIYGPGSTAQMMTPHTYTTSHTHMITSKTHDVTNWTLPNCLNLWQNCHKLTHTNKHWYINLSHHGLKQLDFKGLQSAPQLHIISWLWNYNTRTLSSSILILLPISLYLSLDSAPHFSLSCQANALTISISLSV